jgi:hypothetical protein
MIARHNECSAPGCNNPIRELDHVVPYPEGPTASHNLDGFCEFHHHIKHGNYRVTMDPDGTCHWTTPLGRQYTTDPFEY